ncbi:hypothetical protein BY996DRAFT_6479903, partial [Phakopsora pachyrhizi]
MNVINDQSEQHQNQNHHQQTTMALDPILRLLSSTPATTPSPIQHSTTSTNQPDITPRLPKLLDESRLRITEELDHRSMPCTSSARLINPPSAVPFKPESHSMSRSKSSVVVYSIKKANIGFIAEYVLYAMPGEEAYGKNDIVFACEGFLPLVVDQDWIKEEECWRLFNELKVQKEANSKVLPNLFISNQYKNQALNCPYNLSNNTLSLSSSTTPNSNSTLVPNNLKKRQKSSDNPKRRKKNGNNDDDDDNPNFEGSIQVQGPSNLSTINVSGNDFNGRNDSESNCYAEQSRDNISSSTNRIRFVDPNNQTEEEEELNHSKG